MDRLYYIVKAAMMIGEYQNIDGFDYLGYTELIDITKLCEQIADEFIKDSELWDFEEYVKDRIYQEV